MKKNDPETRLKALEREMEQLASEEPDISLYSEDSFRKAVEEALPSGIAIIDEQGRQVYVNNAFCKMTGWDAFELLGKVPPFLYWSGSDRENLEYSYRLILENRVPEGGFDLLFTRRDGTELPVNLIVSSFEMNGGSKYWLTNVTDITKRKTAEEEMMKSQLLLTSSFESQKDTIVFSTDRQYRYLYFNKAHREAMKFAYNIEVEKGMNFLDCISSDDDRKFLKNLIDDALRGESHSLIQTFGDLNVGHYEVFLNPIRNEKNEIIGCSSLARNITERIHSEQALRESETKFREIINQINDGIIVFDESGKIIIWNIGAEKLSGLSAEEMIETSMSELQYQPSSPAMRDRILSEDLIRDIVRFRNPDIFNQIIDNEITVAHTNELRNIQSIIFPIKLTGYNLFCIVMRDTTEIKRYEKEILRISEEKDKFYSVIAQYLYNPFNLFHNFTKMMSEELDSLSIKEIQKMTASMSKSAANLYTLLDNLLQYTKINQGNILFNPQKIKLKMISIDTISILKPVAESKGISINHFISEDIYVRADIFMLKTILRNLLSHAVRASVSESHISITASRSESDILVSVLDNGSGSDPEYISRLMDINDIHKAIAEAEETGNTLGLYLCKEFVDRHGGRLWVETHGGKGFVFKFTLPVMD